MYLVRKQCECGRTFKVTEALGVDKSTRTKCEPCIRAIPKRTRAAR